MQTVGSPGQGTWRSRAGNMFGSWQISTRAVILAGLIVSVLSVAWGFAGIEGELQLRESGLLLDDTDLTLDAAVASRSHLGEAVRLGAYGDEVLGMDGDRVEGLALSLADDALRTFDTRSRVLLASSGGPELSLRTERYLSAGAALAAALRRDDLASAEVVFTSEFEPAYVELSAALASIRARTVAAFSSSGGLSHAISLATRFLLAVAVPIGAIVVIFDAMRRRQRHRELELELGAERNVMLSKDEFIANVSHELRTPLTIVSGFATLLEDDKSIPAHATEAAGYITREAGELTRMVEDLLTAARADAGSLAIKLEQFAVHSAIEAVVVGDRDGGRIHYELESAIVYADPFRLRQVVRNLLSNAVRHGGPRVRVEGVVHAGEYVVTVADNGDGVAPEIAGRVFDRFVHGSSDQLLAGSVGLGLAIAKSLSERMGIALEYNRVDGETQFTLRIPLVAGAHDPDPSDAIHLYSVGSA